MPTTTNYGWTTPADTDLVKDGAAAIRTLGSSIDTTTKALNPSTTLGDIEYRSSTANTNTRLGIGTTGQILTVSGGVPTWATAAAAGGMTLISETTASALSSLTLGSIPSSYKDILLVWHGLYVSDTNTAYDLRFNNDSGSNYSAHRYFFSATGEIRGGDSTSPRGGDGMGLVAFQNQSTQYASQWQGSCRIYNYASTTRFKKYEYESGGEMSGIGWRGGIASGTYKSTSAITSFDVFAYNGSGTFSNAANTSIRLYGIS